jgi:hypothetical protein
MVAKQETEQPWDGLPCWQLLRCPALGTSAVSLLDIVEDSLENVESTAVSLAEEGLQLLGPVIARSGMYGLGREEPWDSVIIQHQKAL